MNVTQMNIRIAAIIMALLAPALAWSQERQEKEGAELVARFKVVRVTEGSMKDNFTRLRVSDDDGYLNCFLICMNSPYNRAMIDTVGMVRSTQPRLIGYAMERIEQGEPRGSHAIVNGAIRYTVSWHAADIGNMTIEEVQEREE